MDVQTDDWRTKNVYAFNLKKKKKTFFLLFLGGRWGRGGPIGGDGRE